MYLLRARSRICDGFEVPLKRGHSIIQSASGPLNDLQYRGWQRAGIHAPASLMRNIWTRLVLLKPSVKSPSIHKGEL